MLSLLLALGLNVAPAKEVAVPGLSLSVDIPEVPQGEPNPWGHTVGDETIDVRLSMYKAEAFTQVVFNGTWWQTPVDQPIVDLATQVLTTSDKDLEITPAEPVQVPHPTLGTTWRVKAELFDRFLEAPRWADVAVFPIAGATVMVRSVSSESPERATEVLDEVLAMVRVKEAALPPEQLNLGEVTADAGYTLTLPAGMRALTLEEERKLDSSRVAGESAFAGRLARMTVVDTGHLSRELFTCVAQADSTLEILAPAKSPPAERNFRTMATVLLKGGRFRFVNGTQETVFETLPETPVYPEGEPEVGFLSLGDRDAYLLKTAGTLFNEPVHAALFYTTYGNLGLHCAIAAPKDRPELIGTFESIMKGLRVVDGAQHPMPLSVKARYIRWWRWSPYTDPLLQLYWLPIPLFLLAGWLVLRDE